MRTLFFTALFFICFFTNAQDLLESTNNWLEGTGNSPGFIAYPNNSSRDLRNIRETDTNPHGEEVVIWNAVPSGSPGGDGGWDTDFQLINKEKSYRFSVWMKQASDGGLKRFACISTNDLLNINNNSTTTTAYFLNGDLPESNKWYLLVGYVHANNYTETISLGGVYDGETKEKVLDKQDYKFNNTAGDTSISHRINIISILNVDHKLSLYEPRIDVVNGYEPTIEHLLNNGSQHSLNTNPCNNDSLEK